MARKERVRPVTGKVFPELSDDLLHGAGAIALFLFGDANKRRRVYYLASETNLKLPIFRIGNVICARKSTLLEWIEWREGCDEH